MRKSGIATVPPCFAVAVIIVIVGAFFTTIQWIDTQIASNEAPPSTTGLAKPRLPLDLSPGQPVPGN